MIDSTTDIDRESLIEVSKPLFYGFIGLSAVAMIVSTPLAGSFMGVAMMAAISFVAASLADSMDEDWERFTEIIAVVTLLGSLITASYLATLLAFS